MEIHKALTFRASSIGDGLMGKYLLENIHAAYPEAQCSLVVGSRASMLQDLFTAYPWLTVREANRYRLGSLLRLVRGCSGANATVTQYAGKGGAFSLLSKLMARLLTKRGGLVGFRDSFFANNYIFDHVLPYDKEKAIRLHECDALAALTVPLALPVPTMRYQPTADLLETHALVQGKYIVLHMFSGSERRSMSPSQKRCLVTELVQSIPEGMELVLTGGPGDMAAASDLVEGTSARSLAGVLTLQQLMQVIDGAHAIVALDTGAAHLAAQLRKPLIVMHSCHGRSWWLPEQYGKDADIRVLTDRTQCEHGHIEREHPPCLENIAPKVVTEALATRFV